MGRPRKTDSDLRHGWHCVFALHVYLVFVTRYRRNLFSRQHLEAMQAILAKVYKDFEARVGGI
jgi:putative transposase